MPAKNNLTRRQQHDLETAVKAMAADVAAGRLNADMVAAAVGPTLAFRVTRENVRSAAGVVGVALHRRQVGRGAARAALERRVAALEAEVRRLAAAVGGGTLFPAAPQTPAADAAQ